MALWERNEHDTADGKRCTRCKFFQDVCFFPWVDPKHIVRDAWCFACLEGCSRGTIATSREQAGFSNDDPPQDHRRRS